MTAVSFSNILWIDESKLVNQDPLSNEFIESTFKLVSSNNKNNNVWNDWMNLVTKFVPLVSSSSSSLMPGELLAESGNKQMMIQQCSSSSSSKQFVAKFVGYAFWRRLCEHKNKKLSTKNSLSMSSSSSLLGKDALQIERNLVRECLNNLFLLSHWAKRINNNDENKKNKKNNNDQQEESGSFLSPPFCRLLGIGLVQFSSDNGNKSESSSSSSNDVNSNDDSDNNNNNNLLEAPCMIFESLECTLPDFLKLSSSRKMANSDNNQQQQNAEWCDFIQRKLQHDIREKILNELPVMSMKANNKNNDDCHCQYYYYLSAHLDICPNNILVRVNEDNSFNFVLADWDCGVWSKKETTISLGSSSIKQQQEEGENSSITNRNDLLVDIIVKRFGTPPFADDRLLDAQEKLMIMNDEDENSNNNNNNSNNNNNNNAVVLLDDEKYKKNIFGRNTTTNKLHLQSEFVRRCDEYSFRQVLSYVKTFSSSCSFQLNQSREDAGDDDAEIDRVFDTMYHPIEPSEKLATLLKQL